MEVFGNTLLDLFECECGMNYLEKQTRFKSLPPGFKPQELTPEDLLWLYSETEWAWKALEQFAEIQIPATHTDCVMLLGELKTRARQVLGVGK